MKLSKWAGLGACALLLVGACMSPFGARDNPLDLAGTSSSKTLTAFGFVSPAATGTLDESAHTVAVTVPYGTDPTGLVATFTATAPTVMVGGSVQVSGVTANDFTSPVTYTVVAASGATQDYTVSVVYSAAAPTVTTGAASDITAVSAVSGGEVTSDGGPPVTARGVCWSTAHDPTTSDSSTSDGTGTGSFSSSLTDLAPGTLYYVRAYATNTEGTGYGSEVSFTTESQANGGTTIDQPALYTVTITGPTTLHFGTAAQFSLSYTGTPLAYAWYLDTSTLLGTGSTLSVTPTTSEYTYGAHVLMLVVTDANGLQYGGSLPISVQN
jgi:hypothetical protein